MINFGFLKKFKNDNKGMSLVEMIVGIGILSVSVGPLLYMFVYTTKYNAKAKVKQRATNAAVSVMESFKANGLEGAKKKFDAGNFIVGQPAGTGYSYTLTDNTPLDPDDDDFDIAEGTYSISDMTFSDGTETKKYDVTVEVSHGTEATVDRTPLYSKYDDIIFVEDPAISKYFDPYEAANYLIGAGNTFGVDSTEISEITVGRSINIDIVDSKTVTVEYSYSGTYRINGSDKPFSLSSASANVKGLSWPGLAELKQTLTLTAQEDGSFRTLRDVYFYYYPVYVQRTLEEGVTYSVKTSKDKFYFSNHYDDIDFYLFKQKNSAKFSSDLRLKTEESRYSLEPHRTSGMQHDINLYDAVYANLGALNDATATPNIFSSVIDVGAPAGNLTLNYGLSNVDTIPLTAYVTITVSDPSAVPGTDPNLAVLTGTLLR